MATATQEEFGTLGDAATLLPDAVASPDAPTHCITANKPETISHYRVVRLLGQGGMGKVFQAEDTRLQRTVALKVMLPNVASQADACDRFLREARTMAAIRNDHVATIYEVDQADGVPFLAMEFLQGQTLGDWLTTAADRKLGDLLRIGTEIAIGLAAAHAKSLIHRDIKPANIWLETPTGRVKILDFGLARPHSAGTELTQTGAIVGTPSFMSPEQARGEPLDARSDLFSLGVVLYQMATGLLPFRGNSITAVLVALSTTEARPVREINPAIPQALADLIAKLMNKVPEGRPQTAVDVVQALQAIARDTPDAASNFFRPCGVAPSALTPTLGPNAHADTLTESKPAKAPRRPRWKLVGGGAALVTIIAAMIVGWTRLQPSPHVGAAPAANAPTGPPIHVGIVYSRTGTMSGGERAVHDGFLLAIQEINEHGGLLGRPIKAVSEDGQSEETVFAARAEKLITRDKVVVLFGCWTSASRKAVKEVVENRDHLLLYPNCYEGMEMSPNIVYGGCVPNQQMVPGLRWTHGFLNKRRWFLVGLDSIYSHAAHAVIRDEAKSLGCDIVGEAMLQPGETDTVDLMSRIAAAKPDLILNTVRGDTNVALFRALYRSPSAKSLTTLSFSISEDALSGLSPEEIRGHYAAGHYFHSLELPANIEFIKRVHARYEDRVVSPSMQSAYAMVHLWAQAVVAAGVDNPIEVRRSLLGQQFDAPQGRITIDPATRHTVQISRVGQFNAEGRIVEVYLSPRPIVPEPFPASRDRAAWEKLVTDLRESWGGRWSKPDHSK